MKPERWNKIEGIFHKALEVDESRRGSVIEESCAGDEALRREVESLLAHYSDSASFMEQPAYAGRVNTSTVRSVTAAAEPRPDLRGVAVGHYRILEEIGFGGMGVVYKAEDTRLGRLVALKFLPEHMAADSVALERFRREARSASSLNHPNICTIHDIDVYEGREFIVMEYLDGQTLAMYIAGRQAVSTEFVAKLGMPIAEALGAAHSKGVIHRDIKPANIFVTQSGLVKVLDFGVAKLGAEANQSDAATSTKTSTITGTLPYMSPEQLRGEKVDARSDIYALGVVLYETATGHRLYSSSLHARLVDEILNRPASPPSSINGKLSAKADDIILKCLAKDPEDRYQTAKEVAADLRHLSTEATSGIVSAGTSSVRTGKPALWLTAGVVCTLLAIAGVGFYHSRHVSPEVRYTQVTDFTDSAVAPVLSPDGRMLAFIRGSDPFLTADQIYIKTLPDGEPRRLTDDARPKYGPAFSPDGSEIAYTVLESSPPAFWTYTVSVLGGESHLLLKNAAGLVWLDPDHLLFSQIRSGLHLGVVTSSPTRAGLREIYFPAHERGMAHYALPSPDRRRAIVVEMDGNGNWASCRLISLDGQSPAKSIGPDGACMSAGWSPDGSWMYFAAYVQGHGHVWRQRFPDGTPEQITFGATDEEGIAVDPTGQSLITSIGVGESSIWIHDPNGERPLSSEGDVVAYWTPPSFGPDNKVIYYLMRRGQQASYAELWRASAESGKSEVVFPGVSMTAYDISPDGKQVVYVTPASNGTQVWLAPVDRSTPPTKLGGTGGNWPHFGARDEIIFQQTEGNSNYLERMNLDGSNRSKVVPYPITEIQSISPGHRWVIAMVPNPPEGNGAAVTAIPVDGGPAQRLCASYCRPPWSTTGKFLFIQVEWSSRTSPGRSLAIPIGPDETMPADFPAGGIALHSEPSIVKGSQAVPRDFLVPGDDPEHYAYVNSTVHRNLYRISLP
jgi:eukaryotic-like serine/threonine-protein kinase